MKVHLFGKNDSPCCVNFVMKHIAENERDSSELIAKSIDEDFYMDDFIKSENSLETLIHTIVSVTNSLSQFGFRLHKWVANSGDILDSIPESEKLQNIERVKILGINWDTQSDILSLREVNKTFSPTKRGVLSLLCSIYDPLGFVTPCLLEPKLIV